MMHGEVDIDAIRTEAHMEGFKRGYAQAFQSLCEPLAVVEGWMHREMAMPGGICDEDKLEHVFQYEPPPEEKSEHIPVTVTITTRKVESHAH